jgi:hypothetical protein
LSTLYLIIRPVLVTSEHCPIAFDPFTDTVSGDVTGRKEVGRKELIAAWAQTEPHPLKLTLLIQSCCEK